MRVLRSRRTLATVTTETITTNVDVSLESIIPPKLAQKKRRQAAIKVENGTWSVKEPIIQHTAAEIEALSRPPAVNATDLPIPWKGRLGYACLNTVLREMKPPIFCSRTCRLETIKQKGMSFCKELGRQNAEDLSKILLWNERFGIRFMRISSEMFPFASHADLGYTLEHADAELKAAGAIANKFNHRLTVHPGQFTQLATPRQEVVENAIRDLEYHADLLSRLALNDQLNRDAVMIIHMGGMFGDKQSTIERFCKVYPRLSNEVKARLVLENCDMGWTVDDLMPVCKQLGIPLVLDWHHNNICHGSLREGTQDVKDKFVDEITALWKAKGITPKQHYSEPKVGAITGHQRRSHSRRVYHLPPCSPTMDLMIEAKDKEQAVFELARTYNLDSPSCPPIISELPTFDGAEGYYPESNEACLRPPKRVRKIKVADEEPNDSAAELPEEADSLRVARSTRKTRKVAPL